MKPIGFIYLTTNNINNKKYIGQKHYDKNSDSYLGSGKILKLAIDKYGKNNFSRITLCDCYSDKELNEKEKYYIDLYNACENDEFYNISDGGTGGNIWKYKTKEEMKEFQAKMSKLTLGNNNGMYGKHHSKETIVKIVSNRDLSICKSEEFREKISKVTSGINNGMYGKHHTEESKILMSQNRKGLTTGVNNGNYGNIGDKAKNGKAIYKYLDEEHTVLIQKYNTVSQVLEDLKIKGHSALYKAIKNNKSYKGYYWSKEGNV